MVPREAHPLAEVDGVLGPVESEVRQLPLDVLIELLDVFDRYGVRR